MNKIENEVEFRLYMENVKIKKLSPRTMDTYISWLNFLSRNGFDIEKNLDTNENIIDSLRKTENSRSQYNSDHSYESFSSVLNKYRDFLEMTTQVQNVLFDANADKTKSINKLEDKMKDMTPQAKDRVSKYIERGHIADKIKKVTGFKCLICEALGHNPLSFQKEKGGYYIETHHVIPVASLIKGVLGVTNLLTLCANHHRQMHHGKVKVMENTDEHFKFKFDGTELTIKKIKIPSNW